MYFLVGKIVEAKAENEVNKNTFAHIKANKKKKEENGNTQRAKKKTKRMYRAMKKHNEFKDF